MTGLEGRTRLNAYQSRSWADRQSQHPPPASEGERKVPSVGRPSHDSRRGRLACALGSPVLLRSSCVEDSRTGPGTNPGMVPQGHQRTMARSQALLHGTLPPVGVGRPRPGRGDFLGASPGRLGGGSLDEWRSPTGKMGSMG